MFLPEPGCWVFVASKQNEKAKTVKTETEICSNLCITVNENGKM
jgi:hypothetical protein